MKLRGPGFAPHPGQPLEEKKEYFHSKPIIIDVLMSPRKAIEG
jgi:hypothetical protein